MGDLGLAIHIVMFLLISENREDKVSRFTLALPYQKAAGFAFFREQFFCISTWEVPVVPPGEEWENLMSLETMISGRLKT